MKTILVPTDLSELADNALRVAVDLARTYGAEILLVHYQPLSIAAATTMEGSMSMLGYLHEREDADKTELEQIAKNPAYRDVRISPITVKNAGGIYEAITEQNADRAGSPERQPELIVLGTHGTVGWDEWLFGSNAEHIVRHAHCPVLVLKQAVTAFAPQNPVAAIDVDDVLKNNWPAYPFTANGGALTQFVYISTPNDALADGGVHEWMQELAQQNGIADYKLHVRHARTVESGILNYATHRAADLIVLYTHGRTGLSHLLQGSVAEDVLNHATLPVLILRINDGSGQPSSSTN
jgi:nucleotide-binding universal stress UspA family protein